MNITYVVIPVKPLSTSKMRLSRILSPLQRRSLVLAMLTDVLEAVSKSDVVDEAIVISGDERVWRVAEEFEASILPDQGWKLNESIVHATTLCVERGAESLLTLPADVPLVTPRDIHRMVLMASEERLVVLTPSRGGGTNALLRKPPNVIPPCFGEDSFKKHVEKAREKRVKVKVYDSPRLRLDVDTVEDLLAVMKFQAETRTHRLLRRMKFKLGTLKSL